MLTRADFCVYSESGYKGHMACPKTCWYQGGCTCKEAIEKFRQFLIKSLEVTLDKKIEDIDKEEGYA